MLVLFETSAGYAIFKVYETRVDSNLVNTGGVSLV